MRTLDMRFPGFDARSKRGLIRWELFTDHDVREVLLTRRSDTLRVVFIGEPDLIAWTQKLDDAGFPPPFFDGMPSDEIAEMPEDAAA
jgi:hypothetical protein